MDTRLVWLVVATCMVVFVAVVLADIFGRKVHAELAILGIVATAVGAVVGVRVAKRKNGGQA